MRWGRRVSQVSQDQQDLQDPRVREDSVVNLETGDLLVVWGKQVALDPKAQLVHLVKGDSLVPLVRQDHRVDLDPRDLEDSQVKPDPLEKKDLRAYKDYVDHQALMVKEVTEAQLDLLDQQDLVDQQDPEGWLEKGELLEKLVYKVPKDPLAGPDHQDLQGNQEPLELQVNLDHRVYKVCVEVQVNQVKEGILVDLEVQEYKDLGVSLAHQDNRDPLDLLERQVHKGYQVSKDQEDRGDLQDQLVNVVLQAQLDLWDHLDLLVNQV